METKKYYLDRDEWWPMTEICEVDDPYAPRYGPEVEIPVELVEKYQEACRQVHALNNKILEEYYPRDFILGL